MQQYFIIEQTWIHNQGSFEIGHEEEPMNNTATIYIETLKMPDGSLLGFQTVFIDMKQ